MTELRAMMPKVHLIEVLHAHGQRVLSEPDGAFLTLELRELASELSALDAVLASDGGVMHLASASDALTWGLFKVTAPQIYAPYRDHNRETTIVAAAWRKPHRRWSLLP